jgi:hypothetical protein
VLCLIFLEAALILIVIINKYSLLNMDLGDVPARQLKVRDDVGIQTQKLFQNFLEELVDIIFIYIYIYIYVFFCI